MNSYQLKYFFFMKIKTTKLTTYTCYFPKNVVITSLQINDYIFVCLVNTNSLNSFFSYKIIIATERIPYCKERAT